MSKFCFPAVTFQNAVNKRVDAKCVMANMTLLT